MRAERTAAHGEDSRPSFYFVILSVLCFVTSPSETAMFCLDIF